MGVEIVPDELLWPRNQLSFTSGQLLLCLFPYLDLDYLAMEGLLSSPPESEESVKEYKNFSRAL